MRPYVFQIPYFNERTVEEFRRIANDKMIKPKCKRNILTVGLLNGIICALMFGYLFFGIYIITNEYNGNGYIAYMFSSPSWGMTLLFLVILNIMASIFKNQVFPIIMSVFNLVAGLMEVFLSQVFIPPFIAFPCLILFLAIAFSLYTGTRSRMMRVLSIDPGPYNALIVDYNRQEFLLENLNNNQLCCVDEFCEMLKKLNK